MRISPLRTAFSLAALAVAPLAAYAQTAQDTAVLLSATAQDSPPALTLSWPSASAASYSVARKTLAAGSWTTLTTGLLGTATGYTDTNVTVGSSYEYSVTRSSSITGYGYVYAGIRVPLTESRGKLLLLVDNRFTAGLAPELTRLERDLAGDGWTVLRTDIAGTTTVTSVKALIQTAYNADPANVRAVFLFGHIAQPYSGSINPDGHGNHSGAWPADVYYAELSGTWTDTSVSNTTSGTRLSNVPGDGKFDQSTAPTSVELQLGRVDLYDLPAFGVSELELLRRYLDKDHSFRRKLVDVPRRGLIDDGFGYFSGEAFAASGWRTAAAWFGAPGASAGDFMTTLRTTPYLFGYGCGGGGYTSAGGIGTTSDFATQQVHAVFTLLFGSYFGDWDVTDSFLRAPLASSPYALTCAWSGRPQWHLHHMTLGLPIGYSTRATQNNSGSLYRPSSYANYVHVGLMGDPTLRLHPVAPPSQLTTATNAAGHVLLAWTPAAAPVEGYHVYRAADLRGPFARLNAAPIPGAAFTDSAPAGGTNYYMVRAVKLETSGGGTYSNASQGTFAAWPDRRVTLTVTSPYGNVSPPPSVHTYSWYDATVRGTLATSTITLGSTQYVSTGWAGTGAAPASGASNATPLFVLTEDSTLDWQWQTNYWLTAAVDGPGTIAPGSGWQPTGPLTITATPDNPAALFSHWTGSAVPPGKERTLPLAISMDGPRDITAHFVLDPNPGNALPLTETFEAYGPATLLPGVNGWRGSDSEAARVTDDPAVLAALAAYGATHPFPVNTTHALAGQIDRPSSLDVTSAPNAVVTVQMLVRFSPVDPDTLRNPTTATQHMGAVVATDGRFRLLHADPGSGVSMWTTIPSPVVDTSAWHTLTIELDYQTVGLGYRYYRLRLDEGDWLTHANGYTRNDGTGAPGGPWFAMTDPTADRIRGLDLGGPAGVDDILVGESWGSAGADSDGDQLGDLWEYAHFGALDDPLGGAGLDPDGDGVGNLAEFTADTDPRNTASRLVFQSIVREAGGTRLVWRGGRAATQLLEARDDLTNGSWESIGTNLPPTPEINERVDEDWPAGPRFYRLRAVR